MVNTGNDYVRLLRPRYHLLFLTVFLAAVFFGSLPTFGTVIAMAGLYCSFCILLYGGLYTINGIADRHMDAAHPYKRHRPIASGRVSVGKAWTYALLLISLGLLSGALLFGRAVFFIYLVFIASNVLYTYLFKHVPYLELIGNSITHPLRAYLGVTVAQGTIPVHLFLAFWFFALGCATTRRIIEKEGKGENGRPTLKHYTSWDLHMVNVLCGLAILTLWLMDGMHSFAWFAVLLVLHCAIAFLRLHVKPLAKGVAWLLG